MAKLSTQMLFALLLLLSQTALVSHDVQHLGNSHGELCAVYVSQDHSADNTATCDEPTTHSFQPSLQRDIADIIKPVSAPVYASRAPPYTIFSH